MELVTANGRALRLPDFIGVGPGRTGTTWLHAALESHVGLPSGVKETWFWGQKYYKGIEWYASHFRYCDTARPIGEISPYFPVREARERIAQYLPGCKIIITLRDPVERSYSEYRLFQSRGIMHHCFEDSLDAHPRIAETLRYGYHLAGWLELFGRERVLVGLFEDLRADPQRFLDRICAFIGVAAIPLETEKISVHDINSYKRMPRSRFVARRASRLMNWLREKSLYRMLDLFEGGPIAELCFGGGPLYPPLAPEVEARLRKRLLPEIEAVEKLTGFDLSAWKCCDETSPRPSLTSRPG